MLHLPRPFARPFFSSFAAAVGLLGAVACGAPADATNGSNGSTDQDIVGGTVERRWTAAGYLVHGPSMDHLDVGKAACGATLIAPNVVATAAHCVLRAESDTWAFGTGEVGSGALTRVVERVVHPEFHARPEGMIDIPAFLKKNDVAYLILDHASAGTVAALPDAAPADACNVQAIGYHVDGASGHPRRMSAPACVLIKVQLGDDPIFEVHPQGKTGLCNTDGDEGSAVVLRDTSAPILVGFYVGSVTQSVTDCRTGVQFLDGYESAFGYRAFLQEGIDKGKARLP